MFINSQIWFIFGRMKSSVNLLFIVLGNRLKHRGPDWSGLHQFGDCYLAHQRLAIIDPASGDQPLYNEDKSIVVTVSESCSFASLVCH